MYFRVMKAGIESMIDSDVIFHFSHAVFMAKCQLSYCGESHCPTASTPDTALHQQSFYQFILTPM